ncbi:MAG: glycyl-tRNA synthetase, partial [Candidatus Woesearchaeota archaeon]
MTITIDEMATFCKRRGFVFATSDLYGAMAGFFDYGPYGSELKQQLKNAWWQTFVSSRQDVVGFDGAIVANPKVWEASGHAANFGDLIITCTKCKHKERADHFIEDQLNIPGDGLSAKKINELVQENSLICTICKSPFEEVTDFNLMFTTQVGPTGE